MKGTVLGRTVLLGAAALLALSCGDQGTLGVAPRAPLPAGRRADLLGLDLGVPLLTCSPLPSASVTQTIGPDGGTLQVGPHTLSIPPGALLMPVSITATAPSDTVNRIVFQPQGLTFLQPASLTMSYANCGVLGVGPPEQIVYTTDALEILESLPSVDDLTAQTATAPLQHFSDYAIAW
ncbi:MAG TPA: hypothetical protein VH137_10625 [Gemmatimonadales bacterium]|nr:hypothetical protein [Gemmatimonadales bacterium]